jgi:hypothetical protein
MTLIILIGIPLACLAILGFVICYKSTIKELDEETEEEWWDRQW